MEQTNTDKADTGTIKACDACRKKKMRCDPIPEGCKQCTKNKTYCHFTPISKKRKPRRPAGFQKIAELEAKLEKMQGLLKSKGHNTFPESRPYIHDERSPFGVIDLDLDENHHVQAALSGESDTAGVSFPLTPLAQESNDITGRAMRSDQSMIFRPHASWSRSLELGPFSQPSFHEMAAKPAALELVQDIFKNFNSFYPLFDEQDFLEKFEEHYADSSPSNPAWWACINALLSLAHRFRAMHSLNVEQENFQACGYIHNALAVVSELSMLNHSLPAVQALTCMAIVLQGTPDPQTASVLTAAAVRLGQSMGLHRKNEDPSLTDAQLEQRRRVFWITYFIDRDISLRMGQPFAQDDDDMDAELPKRTRAQLPPYSNGFHSIDHLNSRIGLAVIQGQVYKRLYSVQASRQSVVQKAAVARELDSILSYWKASVPVDFEYHAVGLQAGLTVENLHLLILRFTYVICLVMIDRHMLPNEQLPINAALEMQSVFTSSESVCIIESRKAVRLIQILPYGSFACIWVMLHPFFAAVTLLLENVLRYPASPNAQSDLNVVEPYLRLLDTLVGEGGQCSRSEEADRMSRVCNDLYDKGKVAVQDANQGENQF